MIAPMFGMIMLDRNVPNRWTWTRPDLRGASRCAVAVVVAICTLLVDPVMDRCGRPSLV
jgi:hypothetical protein